MKPWLKVGTWVLLAVALIAFIGPRLYVKNANAHLTIDGRVTDDFALYFGPRGRILVDVKRMPDLFVYWPPAPQFINFCRKSDVIFVRSLAITKHHPPSCYESEGFFPGARMTDNSLRFSDGHSKYEVTWQAPPR